MQSRDHVYCSVPRVVFYLSSGYMREPSHDAVNAVCVSTGRSAHAEKLKLSIKGESWLSTEKTPKETCVSCFEIFKKTTTK